MKRSDLLTTADSALDGCHDIARVFTGRPTEQALEVGVALDETHSSSRDEWILEQLHLWVQSLKLRKSGGDREIRRTPGDFEIPVVVV
jgi:hypothetical protein